MLSIKRSSVASPLEVVNIFFGISNSTTGVFLNSLPSSVSRSYFELVFAVRQVACVAYAGIGMIQEILEIIGDFCELLGDYLGQ